MHSSNNHHNHVKSTTFATASLMFGVAIGMIVIISNDLLMIHSFTHPTITRSNKLNHRYNNENQNEITTSSYSTNTKLFMASTLDKTENEVMPKTTTTTNPKANQRERVSQNTDNTASSQPSFRDRVASSSIASAAAMATAAVNAAVSMKQLEAPDSQKSYVTLNENEANVIDEDGLPLRYDKQLIEAYWSKERGALNKRWGQFVGKAVPFLTKLVTLFIREGKIPDDQIPALSRQARMDLQDLGPTFIKAGQMMSVRPDVLPQSTLDELEKLQDSVKPFPTKIAVEQIERELKGPLGQFFTSISEEPVAAASLAQVYLATLNDGKDTKVAIKVQRPDVLSTVSKDLYVLRRAAEVFNGLVQRFAPQQKTDYVALLNEWAIGFYTELDFQNEATNQKKLRKMMLDYNITGVMVPQVYEELCTRRILVSEWIDGKKLSDCSDEVIGQVTPLAQEAFLTQLFETGFFHADPHPGNLLVLNEPTPEGAKLCIIDCGLIATIDSKDRDYMISAVIHLANKNYAALVDDFINLNILPADSNRPTIIPLMDKALTPYVKGGGAKRYEEELKKLYGMEDSMSSQVGGFQAMTQDALTVLQDVPFSIPAYFAILGRAIVTLEGVALKGNPNYGIIMESYPFIARKLLREGRPEIQKALQEVLYSSSDNDSSGLKFTRLLALLNNAAGSVVTKEGAAFVDLDAIPKDGISIQDGLKFVLSDNASSLRSLLIKEMDTAVDLLSRQIFRRGSSEAFVLLSPPRPPSIPFLGDIFPSAPILDEIPLPLLLPARGTSTRPTVSVMTMKEFTNIIAPPLDRNEELFALSLADAGTEFFGTGIGNFLKGEKVISTNTMKLALDAIQNGVLGRSDLLSSSTSQTIIQFLTNAINTIQQRTASATTTDDQSNNNDLQLALNGLNDVERQRFDDIINDLTMRAMERLVQRFEGVERIL